MKAGSSESQDGRCLRYRLEIEGEIAESWAEWFGADVMKTAGGRTIMEVSVQDQAALHGMLRRVHDLHLRLISLTRVNGT